MQNDRNDSLGKENEDYEQQTRPVVSSNLRTAVCWGMWTFSWDLNQGALNENLINTSHNYSFILKMLKY